MGEYIKLDGKPVKLGTCEDLYYARRADLEAAYKAGRLVGQVEEYLKPGWRYRFPFPDEDGRFEIGAYDPFSRGLAVSVPRDYYGANFPHERVCRSVSASGGGFNVNVFFPCPASADFGGFQHSPLPEYFPLEIIQQKSMAGGELWPVCRCGWCGSAFRLDLEDARNLADLITAGYVDKEKDEGRREYWRQVADRLMSGFFQFREGRPEAAQ